MTPTAKLIYRFLCYPSCIFLSPFLRLPLVLSPEVSDFYRWFILAPLSLWLTDLFMSHPRGLGWLGGGKTFSSSYFYEAPHQNFDFNPLTSSCKKCHFWVCPPPPRYWDYLIWTSRGLSGFIQEWAKLRILHHTQKVTKNAPFHPCSLLSWGKEPAVFIEAGGPPLHPWLSLIFAKKPNDRRKNRGKRAEAGGGVQNEKSNTDREGWTTERDEKGERKKVLILFLPFLTRNKKRERQKEDRVE